MALARWKDLCPDANDAAMVAAFWAANDWTVLADPEGNEFCVFTS